MQDELSIAKADIAILVEERNKLFRELEEYKALYSEAASLLNSANYKLSQIRDIAEVKGGLTQRAADLPYVPACVVCGKPVDELGHLVVADERNKLIVTAAYCGVHWQQLGEIESANR